jgi:ATPase family associated with various cellular activities (AAA)
MSAAATGSQLGDLGARLVRELERLHADGADPANAFRGLYIDESEVAVALAETGSGSWAPLSRARLAALRRLFALDQLDVDVLLAALAPDLDTRYERIYAFLQDDITRKRPTVGLLVRLLSDTLDDEAAARARFHPEAPLFRGGLLAFDAGAADVPLLSTAPRPDERVVAHLLGIDSVDGRLLGHTSFEPAPDPAPFSEAAAETIVSAARSGIGLIGLRGPMAAGKRDAARLFAASTGLALLTVDVPALLACPACTPPLAVRLVFREALFLSAAVYWSHAERLWADGDLEAATRRSLEGELERAPIPVLLGGAATWEPPPVLGARPLLTVTVGLPTVAEREVRWRRELGDGATDELDEPIREVAAGFRLTSRQVSDAVRVANSLAAIDGAAPVRARDLYAGARAVSGRRLAELGTRIEPVADWSQLVLPEDSVAQLRELCATFRQRDRVLEEWGFGGRLTGGKGVTALFAGTSGTGKTMAAEVVARELRLALFRIDLSGIVSKWIGETEKNLDRVFEAAWDSNAILFFDEADALFGKRSEVKDSHDRYANLEISYLLQKMESYEGLAILATNMRQQIDDAFLRRLTFNVIFPLPEEQERARIWAAVWPPELPRADDVDFAALARIRLAGGNIKNVVLAGAHFAAAEDRAVALDDLVHGIRREYQKLGKQVSADDIGDSLRRA